MHVPCLYHVEDNEADRRLLALAIAALGKPVELHTANDGEQALALLTSVSAGERRRPDLVIIDLNLPRYTGLEVIQRVRQNRDLTGTPIVVLTSSDSPTDRSQSESLGVVAYLLKPLSFGEYVSVAGTLLQLALSASTSS